MSLSHRSRTTVRLPLATPEEVSREPAPFPSTTAALPSERGFLDWRRRLGCNLSRRGDGRWDALTYIHAADVE